LSSAVALVKGEERNATIARALELISDEFRPGERIVVKPNFVSTTRQLAATHVNAVRTVLDYLRERFEGGSDGSSTGAGSLAGRVVVAESASFSDTLDGYRNFGYHPLKEEYGIELIDLNRDDWVEVDAYNSRLNPVKLRLSRTLAESDTIISVSPPKTHDTVIVTLSLKNVIMGGLIRDQKESSGGLLRKFANLGFSSLIPPFVRDWPPLQSMRDWINRRAIHSDKLAMHQGYPVINLNLFKLAQVVRPHLSIIDGTVGMEGNGPIQGTSVDLGAVIASTDFLAADALAAHLMGFPIDGIGYLHYCALEGMGEADVSELEIRGDTVEECVLPFKPHQTYREQLKWRVDALKDLVPRESTI